MNLLLLLSALLSALTGATQSGRGPAPAHAVQAAAVVSARVSSPVQAVGGRPAQPLPSIVALAIIPFRGFAAVVPALPLYASRRRE